MRLGEVPYRKLTIIVMIEIKPILLKVRFIVGHTDEIDTLIFKSLKQVFQKGLCFRTEIGHLRNFVFQEHQNPIESL